MFSVLAHANTQILFAALLVSLSILLYARPIAEYLDIMDRPDAVRKRHHQETPLVGGLAIMVPVVLWAWAALAWTHVADARLLTAVLLCGAGATLVGYADDQRDTSPSSRMLSLVLLAAVAMVTDPELIPVSLNWGNFSPTAIPVWFGMGFVAFAMAGYVNAVNMADGQNGIVTGMYAIWAFCLMLVTAGTTASIAEVMFETVVITFLFNMAGRIFLGDSGTYGISFVFGILAIWAHNRGGVSAETITVWFFVPVMDCLRLMITRLLKGRGPASAGRDHFHHHLQDRIGKTAGLCTYLGVVGASSVVASLRPHLTLVCMVMLAAFYFSFAWLTEVDDKSIEEAEGSDTPDTTAAAGNVVAFDSRDAAGRN